MKKTDFETQLDSSLDAARSSLTKKEKRLADARSSLAAKHQAVKKLHAADADDKTTRTAEAAVREEQDHVDNIVAAIQEVEQDITRLEKAVADAADKKLRAATAAEVEKIAEQLTAAADNFTRAAAELAAISGVAATFSMDCQGLHALAITLRNDLPQTMATPIAMVRAHAAAVLGGGAPALLPQPAPAALPAPALPELVRVCAVKKIAFTVDGVVRTSPPGSHIELSPEVARRALTLGAVCQLDDPRAKLFESQRSPYVPELANCIGLDAESRAAVSAAASPNGIVQPIRRSAPPIADASRPTLQQVAARSLPPGFTEIDRGPPFSVSIPAGNAQPGPQDGGDDEK
jgi:hypothetical protein